MKNAMTILAALLLSTTVASRAAEAPARPPATETDRRLSADGKGWRLDKAKIGDAARPRVLLIGDSILNGYLKAVTGALEGKAYVDAWVNPYCQSEHVNKLLAEVLDQGLYDVVHFNMGLHGWQKGRIKEGTFEPLTKAYVEVIRRKLPKARIIWASSTPVTVKGQPGALDPEINPIIVEHNRMAAKVMAEMDVPVNDLYSSLAGKLALARGDQFHWTAPAYSILAEAVTRSILQALPTNAPARPASSALSTAGTGARSPAYPVKVSSDGRYLVDQAGAPVFWLGTTQWQLIRDNTTEEAAVILSDAKKKGFSFVQVMLAGVGDGTQPNVNGDKPWVNDDPKTPNEAYFKQADAVMRLAEKENVVISLTLYHQRWRDRITVANARQWAGWLARRYQDLPTIVWSMTPEAREEFLPVLRELASGLREGDGGRHLITFKPDPAPFSSSFAHGENWLDFNSMQTWASVELIRPMIARDYGLEPIKPVLMAEGAYEAGSEYGFAVTPLWVRRQAWYSYLSGAHFTYGHNDSWRMLSTWKRSLDAPGAIQMSLLRAILTARDEWWRLVPDQTLLERGGNTSGKLLNLAARHKDGKWGLVYLASKASVTLNLRRMAAAKRVQATWVDPRDGTAVPAAEFAASAAPEVSTPAGWEDSLLLLETKPDTRPPAVTLTVPASGAVVSDAIACSATATDNKAVMAVQFQAAK